MARGVAPSRPWKNRMSLALLAGASAMLVSGWPDARALGSVGNHFAVAAENESTARAAMHVLESGGNAVDAAITATFMLGVTAPVSCGIGGGGFALVYDASQKRTFALDFRETAPAHYDASILESKAKGARI